MEIDTVFLSGCGTKGNAFMGSFKALIENKIIDLEKIKQSYAPNNKVLIAVVAQTPIQLKSK